MLDYVVDEAGVKANVELGQFPGDAKFNAVAIGFGRRRRIILSPRVLENFTFEERQGLVAHEAGHLKLRHLEQNLVIRLVYFGLAGLAATMAGDGFAEKLAIFFAAALVAHLFLAPMAHWLERRNEFAADQFAFELGYGAELTSALLKADHDSETGRRRHPTSRARIRRLLEQLET